MLTKVNFIIPGNTVSKSNSYRIANRRLYKTAQVKQWEAMASQIAAASWGHHNPFEYKIGIRARIYFKDARRRDIDGPLKSLLDSMNGIIYKDDSQVREINIIKDIDRDFPRIEVEISCYK